MEEREAEILVRFPKGSKKKRGNYTKVVFVTGVNEIGKIFYTLMCVWVHM